MPLLISQRDLKPLIERPESMQGALEAVDQVFREYQRGEGRNYEWLQLRLPGERRVLRAQHGVSTAHGAVVRLYPILGDHRAGPDSRALLLFDAQTGALLTLIGDDDLSTWRTGAPAGVACRYLAPPGARRLAILGSGRQARGQLLAIQQALPYLDVVRVYSPNPSHREQFAREMADWLGVSVSAVDHAERAVRDADVVDVATNSREPVLDATWVRPGALVISIASHQLPPDLILRSRVIVSWRGGLAEGDRVREPYARLTESGVWSQDQIAGELGEVMLGWVPARVRDDEVVLLEMPGMSVWDAAIAHWAYRWANERGTGTPISL